MDILVEFIWIRNSRGYQCFSSGNQGVECDWINLTDNIFWNTVFLCTPASWDLTCNQPIKSERLGNPDGAAFCKPDKVLITVLFNKRRVTMSELECFHFSLAYFNAWKIISD